MSKSVRAAAQAARRRFEVIELPRPRIGPEEGLLRIEACGICGSDIEQFNGEFDDTLALRYPRILGHEPVGRIEEIGELAAARWGLEVGDRVAVEPDVPCFHCRFCIAARYRQCMERLPEPRRYGLVSTHVASGLWGGFSELMYLHPNSLLHKMPGDLPIEIAARVNAMSNGVSWAVTVPGTSMGDSVVVLGCGQRGLSAVVALRAAGAKTVVVTGLARDRHKLELARVLGADAAVDVEKEDLVGIVRELTGGDMADVVVDTTPGYAKAFTDAIEIARIDGTIVLAGTKGGALVKDFTSDIVMRKSLTIKGARGGKPSDWEKAIQILASGRKGLDRLYTHSFGLARAAQAIATLAGEGGEPSIGISIVPGAK